MPRPMMWDPVLSNYIRRAKLHFKCVIRDPNNPCLSFINPSSIENGYGEHYYEDRNKLGKCELREGATGSKRVAFR